MWVVGREHHVHVIRNRRVMWLLAIDGQKSKITKEMCINPEMLSLIQAVSMKDLFHVVEVAENFASFFS